MSYRNFCQNCDYDNVHDTRLTLCPKCSGVMLVYTEIKPEFKKIVEDEESDIINPYGNLPGDLSQDDIDKLLGGCV